MNEFQNNQPWELAVPPKKGNNALISMIAGFLCIIITFSSAVYALNTFIFDIPILNFALRMSGENIDEEFDSMIERMDNEIDIMSDKEKETFEDVFNVTPEEFLDDFSKFSLNTFVKWSNKLIEAESEIEGLSFSERDLEPLLAFKVIRTGLYVYSAIISLFLLLGTLLKRKAFTIIGMILGAGYILAIGGALFIVLFLVTGIVQCVFATRYRKELKLASQPAYQPMA